jgi:GDPmannose 4,6-dehydratase
MHASCGILFNHEGEYRGHEFVTRKITSNVAKIKLGKQERFSLGDLSPRRDWGYAGDYVEAMWLMLQQPDPDDYVISTGVQHSIRDVLNIAFNEVGISDWEHYIESDPRFKRPAELYSLCGDMSKAKNKLNWSPKTTFEDMIKAMIHADVERYNK